MEQTATRTDPLDKRIAAILSQHFPAARARQDNQQELLSAGWATNEMGPGLIAVAFATRRPFPPRQAMDYIVRRYAAVLSQQGGLNAAWRTAELGQPYLLVSDPNA